MNKPKTCNRFIRRTLAALVSIGLALGPLADAARAQTPLADIPIASKVSAKPNIVYTLDDSGSMQFGYLPDWVLGPYCRSGISTAPCSAGGVNTFTSPPYYASSFNHLMYDPNVNYQPPVKYDGNPLTHTIGTDTDALGNQVKFNFVQTDPFNSVGTHQDLTVKVAVPLYCNTDWPITKSGPTGNLTIADIGDVNGENSPPVAGVGDWCRINGTEYTASAASGAPQVTYTNGNVLYDYPYKSSSEIGRAHV